MVLNLSLKRTLSALSLILLIASCASSSNVSLKNSENSDDYWYCAPGDQRTWRCVDDKEALGLNYYRPWKTMSDSEAEQFESDEVEQSGDDLIMVRGAQVSPAVGLSEETVNETVEDTGEDTLVKSALPEEPLTQEHSTQEGLEQTATETKPLYGKVLQLGAYHSQSQAQSFADSLDEKLLHQLSVIRTRVNGQIYYTVVYEQLNSQQDAEKLIDQLAEYFPTIQPWLRSRTGFEILRAD